MAFVVYGLDLWDSSLRLGFVKYGGFCHGFCQLGFVKYGRQDLSIMGGTEGTLALICYYYLEASVPCALFLGVCHFDWGLSYMGWIFGICHCGWGLSNMGGFCHGFCQGTDGLICYYTFRALCPPSFGVCHLDWVLSHMGWIFGICRYGWDLSNRKYLLLP